MVDECGICDDDATNDCVQDCSGVFGGPLVNDCAGICGGDAVIGGCDNVCGSTAEEDCAGVCNGTTVVDCAGTCGGSAVLSGCDNLCESTAIIDDCGVCGGDSSTCTSFSEPPNWDCIIGDLSEVSNGTGVIDDFNNYQNSATITGIVSFNGSLDVDNGDMLGVFVGSELRGIGTTLEAPFGTYAGEFLFFTTIYSLSLIHI